MWADWESGSFALPPGVDFCAGVVRGLMARVGTKPPEALAAITIHVNSGRTLLRLRAAFDDYAALHGPLLLPKLRLLSDLGADLPGAVAPPLGRVLELGRLVAHLMERNPALGAGQSVPQLAQSLAALMAEMQSEGCGTDSLSRIDAQGHAAHWQRSLAFLRIAAGFYLSDPPIDAPARQRRMAEAISAAWLAGTGLPQAPVLAVGSTGSHGATRLFLRALAAQPLGAVVLPGYDFTLPEPIWSALADGGDDHPQARLALLRQGGVRPWTDSAPDDRNRLISLALRPAPVTDQWIAEAPSLPELSAPTAGLTLIEADQPQQEADAIAILIRDAVGRGQPVRLFAADRAIVRRVASVLDRWDLLIDDSAGEPLQLAPQGLFLRHVAALFGQKLGVDTLLVLLKHPVTATGNAQGHGESLRQTRELELHLRRHGPAFPDAQSLRDWADRGDEARKIWVNWLAPILDVVGASESDRAPLPVPERLAAHLALAGMLAAGPGGQVADSTLWNDAGGRAADMAMTHLADHAAI
ncbi:MAG: double-strand break repair protein AddB, partial [Paracoccus sp. (in: a-proteobacteria)]|nr:double-strand break repair protein AddB [Paracoccus sp. (in: a-proteobacteria)]